MSALEQSSNELDRLLNELQQEKGTLHSEYHHYQQTSSTSGGQNLTQQRLPPHPPPSVGSAAYFPLERGHGSLFAIPPPHGNPRSSSSQARYTTRITRDHHQKANSPITLKLDASGLQDNTFKKSQEIKTVSVTNREKRLVDELLQARQEIAQLKRTTSLMDHPIYSSNPPPNVETTWNSSSYSKRMEMKQQPGSISDFQRLHETERQRHDSVGFGKQNENGQGTLSYKKSIITSDGTKVDLFSENKYTGSYVGTALSSPRSVRRATHLHGAGSTFSKKSSQHQSLSESQTTEKKSQSTTSATPSHISPNTLQQQSGKEVTTFDRSLAFHRSVRNRSPQPLSVFLANLHSTSNEMNSILENGTIQRKTLTSGEQTIPVVRVNKSADEVMNEPSRGRPLMDSRSSIPPLNNYNNGDSNGNGNSTVTGNGLNRNGGGGPPNNTQALPLSRITTNGSMTTPMATQNQQSYGKEESIAGGEVTEYKKTTTIKKIIHTDSLPFSVTQSSTHVAPPLPLPSSSILSLPPPAPPQPAFSFSNFVDQESSTFERRIEQPTTNYSAHQENMRVQQQQQQSQQQLIQQHTSSEQRYVEHPSEVFEEIETITLQPIGKGVQDLESSKSATMPRTPGAATPMIFQQGSPTSTESVCSQICPSVSGSFSGVQDNTRMLLSREVHHLPTKKQYPQYPRHRDMTPSNNWIPVQCVDCQPRNICCMSHSPPLQEMNCENCYCHMCNAPEHAVYPCQINQPCHCEVSSYQNPTLCTACVEEHGGYSTPIQAWHYDKEHMNATIQDSGWNGHNEYMSYYPNPTPYLQGNNNYQDDVDVAWSNYVDQEIVEPPIRVHDRTSSTVVNPGGFYYTYQRVNHAPTSVKNKKLQNGHRGDNASPGFATLPSGGGRFNQQQFSSSTTHMSTMQRGHHQQYGTLNNSINTLGSKSHQRAGKKS